MEEKITKTQRVYDGHLVKLDLLDVELPNGKTSHREVIQHPGAVAIVALDDDQNILMVRQFRIAAGKTLWEVPAGTLDPDETPEACAIRELQEETGYKPNKLEALDGIYTAPGYTSEYIYLFLATELEESRLDMDEDEFIEMKKIPLTEVLAKIESGEIQDGKTVTGVLRAARRLKI